MLSSLLVRRIVVVAFDILRTMQLCCTGAQVPFLDYMKWVLVNHKEAKASPALWTPYAYRLKTHSSQ